MKTWSLSILYIIISFEFIYAGHHRRCATCNERQFEEYKALRQEQILDDLLMKLDLTSKPNVTVDYDNLPPLNRANQKIKQLVEASVMEKKRRMKRGYDNNYIASENGYYPSLYEVDPEIIPQTSFIKSSPIPYYSDEEDIEMALFPFSSTFQTKIVNKATLHIFVRPPSSIGQDEAVPLRANVYERFMNGTKGDRIATKHIHVHGTSDPYGVFKIHLDPLDVQRWFREKVDGNIGIYVEAMYEGENLAVHPMDANSDSMFLELEILDGSGRGKRAPNICTQGGNDTKCCLYDLIIDFEKVGWEFVIAPKRYNAYICSGECSAGQISSTARGTIAQHARLDFFQCCHPKDYVGITIVYVTNDNHIWVKEVPGMIARKCGCA